jgi:hypothetical protein
LRILGTAVFVGFLIYRIELTELREGISQFSPGLYLVFFGLFLFGQWLSSIRWKILLASQQIPVRLSRLFRYYLLGYVWNFTLPSDMGGDIVKIYKIIGEEAGKHAKVGAVLATAMDRLLGLLAIVCLIAVAAAVSPLLPQALRIGITAASLAALVAFGLLYFRKLPFAGRLVRWLAGRLGKASVAEKLLSALALFRSSPRSFFVAFGISVGFQLLGVFNQWIAFRVVGVEVPLVALFFAVPVTRLLTALPLSMGGIGLKEVGLFGLLASVGVTSTQVVAFSLVGYSEILLVVAGYGLFHFATMVLRRRAVQNRS